MVRRLMMIARAAGLALALTPSLGVTQDFGYDVAAAFRHWSTLAESGDALGQLNLGHSYSWGIGAPKDDTEAVRWYRLAAEQGNAGALYFLGRKYHYGEGVPQDYAEAMRWYRLAAELGDELAHYGLGVLFAQGKGVSQDFITAHMWFNIATANGDPQGSDSRDIVAARMTAADISEAQRRARVCMASGYQDCD